MKHAAGLAVLFTTVLGFSSEHGKLVQQVVAGYSWAKSQVEGRRTTQILGSSYHHSKSLSLDADAVDIAASHPTFNVATETTTPFLPRFYEDRHCTSARAKEIAATVGTNFILPAMTSMVQHGWPASWIDFWHFRTTSSQGIFPSKADRQPITWNSRNASTHVISSQNNGSSARDHGRTLAQHLTATVERLGPTYVKFGQAMSSRSDIIPPPLTVALSKLQDEMTPTFDTSTAKRILHEELRANTACTSGTERIISCLIDSLTSEPIATASIGQVYRSSLPGYGLVAVKIQRPGLRDLVYRDWALLRSVAHWIESLHYPSWWMRGAQDLRSLDQHGCHRIVQAQLVNAVDEFMTRVTEELDYRNEANNMIQFANLYSHRRTKPPKSRQLTSVQSTTHGNVDVVVPHVYLDYCTENVLVMEWIEGTKLADWTTVDGPGPGSDAWKENLDILRSASAATLSQLFDTGLLHADPHSGNLLKVHTTEAITMRVHGLEENIKSVPRLGYLDFGMVSTVPQTVRDGLVCAVAQMVFGRNVTAVADLFGELQLMDTNILEDTNQRTALIASLDTILNDVLHYPMDVGSSHKDRQKRNSTDIPKLRFERLVGGLTGLVTQFALQLPPYFLNNARAMVTLEGIIQKLDPSHNAMEAIYPFAVKRLFGNPSGSPIVERTLLDLVRHPKTGLIAISQVVNLLDDAALVSGQKRRQVVRDVLSTPGGRRILSKIVLALLGQTGGIAVDAIRRQRRRLFPINRHRRSRLLDYLRL